MYTWLVACCSG